MLRDQCSTNWLQGRKLYDCNDSKVSFNDDTACVGAESWWCG